MTYRGQTVPEDAVLHQDFWTLHDVLGLSIDDTVDADLTEYAWENFIEDLGAVERIHYDDLAGDRYLTLIEIGDSDGLMGLWVTIYDGEKWVT